MFAVMGVSGISPAEIGLILTYTTQLTQMLTVVTRQTTDVEVGLLRLLSALACINPLQNYMNAVERGEFLLTKWTSYLILLSG
jgi:hypothetical protein